MGRTDPQLFLDSGRRENQILRDSVAKVGRPVSGMDAILDWGCGCGRVVRWWADLDSTTVHGCDYNERLVGWVSHNLPFAKARRNGLAPPLPYQKDSFDFVYAFSVLTHLTDQNAIAWMAEIKRVLHPGGLFFLTTHGEFQANRIIGADARRRFARGESTVQYTSVEGTNLCAAYHPRSFVESTLAADFDVLQATETHTLEEDDPRWSPQDSYLIRKPYN
jgi:2-polyprenyl-3-methyl-5-hydroxy-6-metoxy-1,4-benzoquinol methylase